MEHFMELDMKKCQILKEALPFEVWSLKTSLGQFGPKKALCNELMKPLDKNPGFSFQKQGLIFSGIMR